MTNKATKYGLMTIAAVLLVTLAFAGAASADDIEPYHQTGSTTVIKANDDGTYTSGFPVSDVYFIANEENWRYVVNHTDLWDKTFVLTNDITFTEPVKSVYNSTYMFNGTIYGNGSKFVNFTQFGPDAHGLIYNATGGCVLNNVHLYDSNIESSSRYVGGLVSIANQTGSNSVQLCGCSVTFSNITSIDQSVGGLVGAARTAKLWVNASWVDHIYVETSATYMGGLVGSANEKSSLNISNSWVNCSEIHGLKNMVGGVLGVAYAPIMLTNISVRDCKVLASGNDLGGLVGYADKSNSKLYVGCRVENCTLISTAAAVGGLVGGIAANPTSTFNGGWVNYTWVNGTSNVGSIFGYNQSSIQFTDDSIPRHTMVYNGTGSGFSTTWAASENSFNDTMSLSTALSAGVGSLIDKKNLIAGKDYGYCSVTLNVSEDDSVTHGSLNATPNIGSLGTSIKVTTKNDLGYHLNWTYYCPAIGSTAVFEIEDGEFLLPAYNVTVSSDFKANVSTVVFYNETNEEIGSYINTYDSSKNFTDYVPTRAGYTPWWNISESGVNLNTYVNNDNWVFTGNNASVLHAYVNWTANTYTVHFNPNGGQGSMDNMTFTYDVGQNLTANAFQRYNCNFLYWTNNGTKYYNTEFVQNLTSNQGDTVELVAQWETYSTSGSKNTGYSVILQDTGDAADTAANMYTVNFTMNGHGIQVMNQSVSFGNTADEPSPVPTADGYTFTGWYTDKGLVSKYAFSTPVTDDIELYAGWATKDAKIPTSKSPAPFVGLLVGLGAVAVLLSNRRK